MVRSAAAFVIMAGGRGERLWPLVRAEVPKACVSIDGRRTLLETTIARLQPLARPDALLIVTTEAQAGPIRRGLPPRLRRALVVEPQPKNTAACIALAATVLARRDPAMVMVALPADHWIQPAAAFRRSLRAAIELARHDNRLVTIGLRPTRAHPGLGYLCRGTPVGVRAGCRVFRLNRFVEKPTRRVAQQLMRQRKAYWNAGIFVGQVRTFLELTRRWLPDHARLVFPLGALAGRSTVGRRTEAAYRKLRAVSFDDGVMAHVRDGYVVEGCFDWEDLGSWDSWVRISPREQPTLTIAGRNVRVVGSDGDHLIATVGLGDLTIIRTPDATLVCHTRATQAVRDVVVRLSRDQRLARYV